MIFNGQLIIFEILSSLKTNHSLQFHLKISLYSSALFSLYLNDHDHTIIIDIIPSSILFNIQFISILPIKFNGISFSKFYHLNINIHLHFLLIDSLKSLISSFICFKLYLNFINMNWILILLIFQKLKVEELIFQLGKFFNNSFFNNDKIISNSMTLDYIRNILYPSFIYSIMILISQLHYRKMIIFKISHILQDHWLNSLIYKKFMQSHSLSLLK